MKRYDTDYGAIGTHTCRLTLMDRDYVGHVTFTIGGNCCGASILDHALDYLEDPARFESDCQLKYDEETYEYSFVLSNGEKAIEYDSIDYSDLADMIVAVEIIDYVRKDGI